MSRTAGRGLGGLPFGMLIAPTALGVSATGVSLPQLGRSLHLTSSATAWVLAGYALSLAVGFVLSGRIAERQGLRRTMVIGAVQLAAGSVIAATSFSFASLLTGRLIQGLGAAAVSIAALGAIDAAVPAERRAKVLGVMTAVIAAASGSGALIGGLLTDSIGWRAVVALPALALLTVPKLLAVMSGRTAAPGDFDLSGAALLSVAAAGLVVVLQARATGLPTLATVVVGATTLVAALTTAAHVRSRPDGFLPLEVVASRPFQSLSATGMTLFAGYLSALFVVPLGLASMTGWGPLHIGAVLLPAAAVAVVASGLAGRAARRMEHRRAAICLTLVSAGSLAIAAVAPSVPTYVLALTGTICGFAGGQVVLLDAVPLAIAGPRIATAISVFNFLFFLGGATGAGLAALLIGMTTLPSTLGVAAVVPLLGAGLALTMRRTGPTAEAGLALRLSE